VSTGTLGWPYGTPWDNMGDTCETHIRGGSDHGVCWQPGINVPALREALERWTGAEPLIVGLLAADPAVKVDLAPEYRDRMRALSATAADKRRSAGA
jgi:hypothetical protein